jgi:apolipoprotein N-acyltransferase
MEQYIGLTQKAVEHKPDLIIWPETSYPGYLWGDNGLFIELQEYVRRIQIPLLFGSVIHEGEDYFNTAILLSSNGDVVKTYRKVHLVAFGEYLPLRSILPFLSKLVAIGDFSAGDQWTVFSAHGSGEETRQDNPFSVLICFEDTVARLSRQFVREGAQLLINITNDAWFGDSKAPFMHLQSSVFRTVENRRGLVRAANTGVSCFIDQWGRIGKCVEKINGSTKRKTYISSFAYQNVDFSSSKTFYTKFGDVFTIFCFGCILFGILREIRTKI